MIVPAQSIPTEHRDHLATVTLYLNIVEDGNVVIEHSTFSDFPVAVGTIGTLILEPGNHDPVLSLDVDGDGIEDFEIMPDSPAPPSAFLAVLRQVVTGMNLIQGIEQSLLAKIEAANESLGSENYHAASGQVGSLVNYLNSLKQNHISDEDRLTLVQLAETAQGLVLELAAVNNAKSVGDDSSSLPQPNDTDVDDTAQAHPSPRFRDRATPFLGELCDCHEDGADGTDDLLVKFSKSEVVDTLILDPLPENTELELVLVGSYIDGSPFSARDCVVLAPTPGGGPTREQNPNDPEGASDAQQQPAENALSGTCGCGGFAMILLAFGLTLLRTRLGFLKR